MILHAVIIDDEYNGMRSLELLIQKFVPEIKIVALTSSPFEGVELINSYRPDIVFLDINMPALNGFELLDKLEYKQFYLVFTTAYKEYAIKAIKQAATDYLLKPIDLGMLKVCVEKIKNKAVENKFDTNVKELVNEIVGIKNLRIPIPTKNSVEYVIPSSIIYIEANSNSSKILLTNMIVLDVNKSLKEYESLLCRDGLYFMRIHNSFIVNLNYVIRYSKEGGGQIVLYGNKLIPLSKQRKEDFLKFIKLSDESV